MNMLVLYRLVVMQWSLSDPPKIITSVY